MESYLDDVPFNFVETKVSLLIGMDRAEMMKPLKVVDGPHNSSYATLHQLGWALNGAVKREVNNYRMNNRVSVSDISDLNAKIREFYEQDFKDSHISKKDLSHDDILWHNIMKNSN